MSLLVDHSQVLRSTSVIRSVSRASTFSVLKFIEIVFFGVYSPSLFGFCLFWHFCDIFFQFSYFVWLRITDDGSVLEMRIWSIQYCKCLYTQYLVAKYMPKAHYRFSKGGGGFNISSSLYFHFVIKHLLSICGLHFWSPQSENGLCLK